MKLTFEPAEAHAVMSLITSAVIDGADLSAAGKEEIRRWRRGHDNPSPALDSLVQNINHVLGGFAEEKTDRTIRRKGRYVRSREAK
jgi:hypothetical protein